MAPADDIDRNESWNIKLTIIGLGESQKTISSNPMKTLQPYGLGPISWGRSLLFKLMNPLSKR